MSTVIPRIYRLGRLPFTLSGAGECVASLHAELAPLLDSEARGATPDPRASHPAYRLAFEFVDALPPLTGYTATRPVSVLDDAIRVAYRGLEYHMSRSDGRAVDRPPPYHPSRTPASIGFDHAGSAGSAGSAVGELRVTLRQTDSGRRGRFAVALQRARDPGFLSIDERRARGFMYDVFDYVVQLAQLPLGQSFVHASAVERNGCATAIVAWSGVGKTAALLQLITRHGFRYLSDDVALVDDSGMLWRTPKLIQLKGINVAGSEQLRAMLLAGRTRLDRFSWAQRLRRHGPLGVRRRVSAEQLLGERAVAWSAPLGQVYCLERADVADFDASEISPAELCKRAATVVMDVMEPFTFLSHAIRSGSRGSILPSYEQVLHETTDVLARAFRSVQVVNVRIPLAASPAALADYLAERIGGSAASGMMPMALAGRSDRRFVLEGARKYRPGD